ncbi:MAG TPA: LacI family DNA-binding transcriptional regulator [Steroidobacteraceae bacterium]|jgi:LacI family transcriptional regulator|nr:LacI family DNA-binding transcriptional regulator [Steroidobacteraceae bacterium]
MTRRTVRSHRPATIADVAKLAKVSIVSASRVINDSPTVRESTRRAVRGAMLELGYTPNAAAQMLRTKRSNIMGCVVPDLSNHVTAAVVHAAEKELNGAGLLLVTASSDLSAQREAQLVQSLCQRGVGGLLIQPGDETSALVSGAITRAGVPVVLLDRDVEVPSDRVLFEHYDATRQVVRYLLDLGHRDIAIIATAETARPGRERLRAFRDELAAHGLGRIPDGRIFCGSHLAQHGFDAAMALMSAPSPPTALIAAGNLIVLGALKALQSMQIDIPGRLSFVGSDNPLVSEIMTPPLTVIERDNASLGQLAARLLMARVKAAGQPHRGLERMTLQSRVILRRSCAPLSPRTTGAKSR